MANPLYGQNKADGLIDNQVGGCFMIDPAGTDGSTGTPTKTLVAADSGNTYFINIASNTVYVQLPAPADGLKFKFILHTLSNGEASKDFVLQTSADSVDIQGHIFEDQAALTPITVDTSMVQWDSSDGAATAGDWISVICFDSNWYATGVADKANAIDIADARA